MNERIDNLQWQAGGYTKLNYPNDTFLDGRYALTQLQLDKFAELLVKECAKLANEETSLPYDSYSEKIKNISELKNEPRTYCTVQNRMPRPGQ